MHNTKEKLVLSTREFYHLIEVDKIVYCKSENTYTTFYLLDGEEIKVSVPIKTVEQQLDSSLFMRPHQSYLVNVQHIKSVQKSGSGEIILNNGKVITISSRKRSDVLHFLENIARIQI